VTARSRAWFNPDLYSRNYVVPGVVADIIMMVTLMVEAEHGKELPNAVWKHLHVLAVRFR
jgi:hypothetical protein